jgi:hypothetical protein
MDFKQSRLYLRLNLGMNMETQAGEMPFENLMDEDDDVQTAGAGESAAPTVAFPFTFALDGDGAQFGAVREELNKKRPQSQ